MQDTATHPIIKHIKFGERVIRSLLTVFTDEELQDFVDAPIALRQKYAKAWREMLDQHRVANSAPMPETPRAEGVSALVDYVLASVSRAGDLENRQKFIAKLMVPGALADQADLQLPRDVTAVVLYFGLASKRTYLDDIAQRLEIKKERVKELIDRCAPRLVYGKRERFAQAMMDDYRPGDLPIDDLELTSATRNILARSQILTIDDLRRKTREELLDLNLFGKNRLDEVVTKLGLRGMSLRPSR